MLITALLSFVFIAVPIGYAGHLWRLDEPAKIGWVIAFLITAAVFILVLLVGRWDIAGLGTRYVIGCIVLAVSLISLRRHADRPWLIAGWTDIWHRRSTSVISLALLGGASIYVLIGTRPAPAAHAMAFPLTGGRFVIGQGGNNSLLNYHQGHHAQRYASDITAVNTAGFRASTLLPRELSDYVIFGARVVSPCAGTVVSSVDGLPDMPPASRDRQNARGNHIAIVCAGVRLELAHLKEGSVKPRVGASVQVGDLLGQVGNSGNSTEPHLHIHGVQPATGLAIPITFDGIAAVRNTVFRR